MGLALYITLQRSIPECEDSAISGKSIARAQMELKQRCDELNIPELMTFYSEPPGETAALLDGAGDVMADAMENMQRMQHRLSKSSEDEQSKPDALREQLNAAALAARNAPEKPERWFPAADGLKTVTTLLASLEADAQAGRHIEFSDPLVRVDPILADLREIQRLLEAADAAGVGFHVSFDF
jgi:hypothetical protein